MSLRRTWLHGAVPRDKNVAALHYIPLHLIQNTMQTVYVQIITVQCMSRNYKRINWQSHYAYLQRIVRSKSLRLIRTKPKKERFLTHWESWFHIFTRLNRGDRRKNKIDFHVVLSSRIHQPNQKISVIYTLRNLKNSNKDIYLYTCANYSSLWRYLSQGNPFRSISALD